MAWSALSTLMVVMPIAAAGLRLMPRSSRNTHSAGSTREQLAGDLVEARLGLAHADLARLDDLIEPSHHLGDVLARVAADDVVREAGRRVAGGLDRVECDDHLRAHLAGQQREDVGAGDAMSERRRLDGETRVEVDRPDVVALEMRPRVVVGIGGVDRPDEPGWQLVIVLVAR